MSILAFGKVETVNKIKLNVNNMELNIYIKNVGQGDTIFIDWESDEGNNKKYAMIDCNLVNNDINPIIQHIENHKIENFEFVVMSHPHSDHFSGFILFFEYCEENNITINELKHTCNYNPDFLNTLISNHDHKKDFDTLSSVNFQGHKRKLKKLFEFIILQEKNGFNSFLKSFSPVNTKGELLVDNVFIKFLAPVHSETIRYMKENYDIENQVGLSLMQSDPENNPSANLLASFINIYSDKDNWQIFLTSDCTNTVFERLLTNESFKNDLQRKKLLALQVPHHGSFKNHYAKLWNCVTMPADTPALISVGENYGHPSVDVIEYFHNQFNSVHATNNVGGYREYYSDSKSHEDFRIIEQVMNLPGMAPVTGIPLKLIANTGQPCGDKHIKVESRDGRVNCDVIPSRR